MLSSAVRRNGVWIRSLRKSDFRRLAFSRIWRSTSQNLSTLAKYVRDTLIILRSTSQSLSTLAKYIRDTLIILRRVRDLNSRDPFEPATFLPTQSGGGEI